MRRDRVRWFVVALCSALLFVAVGWVVGRTTPGTRLDDALTGAVLNLLPAQLRRGLDAFARPLVIVVLAPAALVLALLAAVRLAWRRVFAATVVALASSALTLLLPVQHLLGLGSDAYPSDHATVAFALLVAVVMLWPSPVGRRGLVAAGVLVVCVGLGNVSWYAHHVVDVVGSALLVSTVTAAALTVTGGSAANLERSRRD
jgi:membrane-associated phospholipid phosphatase